MAKSGKQRQQEYIKRLKKDPIKYSEYLENSSLYTSNWLERDENKRLKSMLSSHSKQDRRKGREFNLTMEWCRENISGKECTYCGTKDLIGVDRVDNSIGHIKSNCHPVCKRCNCIKSAYRTHEEMLEFRKLVDSVGFEEARLMTILSKEDKEKWKKEYYTLNKENILKECKKYYTKRREEIKSRTRQYYKKNKNIISSKQKLWREKNKILLAKKSREYLKKNREKVQEYKRLYREKNRAILAEKQRLYILNKKNKG